MRLDAIGLFWEDVPRTGRGDGVLRRVMPAIPDTGWTTPTEFPDLRAARALSFDVETYDPHFKKQGPGWARGDGHISGLAVGTDDGRRWYFPMRHEVEPEYNLDPEHVLAWARDNLSNPRQPKVGANLTYDIGWLRQEGVRVAGELHDVQFAESLLHEARTVALEDLGQRYLDEGKVGDELYTWCATYYGGNETAIQRRNIYRAPPRLVGPYAESDADLPLRILSRQWPLLHAEGLWEVYRMECDLIPLMIEMRYAGVSVDIDATVQLKEQLQRELDDEHRRLEERVGFGVDVWANESLARVFDSLSLPYNKTKKTGKPSFTVGFLEGLEHPVGQAIREIRQRSKLITTFLDSYILDSHVNGKLYGQFHQLRSDEKGARSGRLSSSNPNLQNIPARTELGKLIRRVFVKDEGHLRWRKHDYSQIEYRGLAHYAVGPMADHVRELYRTDPNIDFHNMTQELIASMTGQELKRGDVKNTNFGLVYGMGIKALSRRLGLTAQEGKKLFASYHKGAPFVRATMEATSKEAERLGYITTILGRRSRFDLWESADRFNDDDGKRQALPVEQAVRTWSSIKRAYLHKALNRRLQGSAADLIKMAMLRCWQDGIFDATGVPRLTVHDELDFSDPGGRDEAFAAMLHVMETAVPFRVPVRVGTEIGPNWGDVEEVAA
jgi:DNA polymerase I-like protein with 3'-5' exonuclease and polymerase domains